MIWLSSFKWIQIVPGDQTGERLMIASGKIHEAAGDARLLPYRWLVRSPNPLGDACMSLPAVRALKKSQPNVHLTVCCRDNLAPMWAAREEVDAVIPFAKGLGPFAVGQMIRRNGSFDEGLVLPNSFRSAFELRLAGVSRLTGYARYQRGILLHRAVKEPAPSPEKQHHVHRYLHLIEAMGIQMGPLEELLAIPTAPTPMTGGSAGGAIHLGICPGAEYGNAKRYPIERYAAAIEALRSRRADLTIRVSIFGSWQSPG